MIIRSNIDGNGQNIKRELEEDYNNMYMKRILFRLYETLKYYIINAIENCKIYLTNNLL